MLEVGFSDRTLAIQKKQNSRKGDNVPARHNGGSSIGTVGKGPDREYWRIFNEEMSPQMTKNFKEQEEKRIEREQKDKYLTVDSEIEGLAKQVLCNAFWKDYSDLVTRYLEAGEGLEFLKESLQTRSSVYTIDSKALGDFFLNIWAETKKGGTVGYANLLDALKSGITQEVYVQGEKVFEKVNGEWRYIYED